MADNTIKTVIKLRNDTLANWETSTVKIRQGEVALALHTEDGGSWYEMRIGVPTANDVGKTWNELSSSKVKIPHTEVIDWNSSIYEYRLNETVSNGISTIQLEKKTLDGTTWTSVGTAFKTTGDYSDSNPIALKDYVDDAVDGASTQFFSTVRTTGQTDEQAIAAAVGSTTPKGGSICVIKTQISDTGKYEYKAFVYDTTTNPNTPAWKAIDGEYDARNVYFHDDLLATYTIGRYTPGTSGNVTIPTKGKSVYDVFDDIVSKELQPSIKSNPAVSISAGNFKAYEVGSTTSTLSYTASLSAGSYTYGPATGITATSWSVAPTSGSTTETSGTKTVASGDYGTFRVSDTTSFGITATATHGAGAVAVTNKGNASSPTIQIAAGNKSANTAKVTGFRYTFYGTVTNKNTITSAIIRGLTNKTTNALSNTTLAVGGALRVIIAIPKAKPTGAKGTYNTYSGAALSKVLDVNDSNSNITTTFTKTEVSVNDANGANPITYSVYYVDFASAHDTDNFTITQ